MSYRAIARELELHPAIASLRLTLGAYRSHCDFVGQWVSALVSSDLDHDERAITGNPTTAFAWIVNPLGTYMVRAFGGADGTYRMGEVTGAGSGIRPQNRSQCVAYLRAAADSCREKHATVWFRFWNGDSMVAYQTIDELVDAFMRHDTE